MNDSFRQQRAPFFTRPIPWAELSAPLNERAVVCLDNSPLLRFDALDQPRRQAPAETRILPHGR